MSCQKTFCMILGVDVVYFSETPAECPPRGGGGGPEGRGGQHGRDAGPRGTPHGRLGQGQYYIKYGRRCLSPSWATAA